MNPHEPAFDWDDDSNVGKVESHNVTPIEAEEAILDLKAVPTLAHSTPTERRRGIIGMTDARRILVVVFTIRDSAIRVVTAYDAPERSKRRYDRRKG